MSNFEFLIKTFLDHTHYFYSCDYWYQFLRNVTGYCLDNGSWSRHAPSCQISMVAQIQLTDVIMGPSFSEMISDTVSMMDRGGPCP